MSDVVIRAEGLGKSYLIGHRAERERYTALRDVAARGLRGLWRNAADLAHGRALVAGETVEEFWALRDVDFEVRRGEVLGIIGRNGAGKSTLLKILSRITEPSAGRVSLRGRVASLLEVGTGFHPELTGRENILLNGAILGMTRAEIREKFDEIVAFAEVGKFLDTPVKRYSSGMYVRLAFAVAAHLDPEILIVDEVLAVGDAQFQKRCLGKMEEVAGHGRTVLFVSHNMGAVRRLCDRAILLRDGRLDYDGSTNVVVSRYVSGQGVTDHQIDLSTATRSGTGEVAIKRLALSGAGGSSSRFQIFEEIKIEVTLASTTAGPFNAACWILLRNAAGDDVAIIMQQDTGLEALLFDGQKLVCSFDANLAPGRYSVAVGVLQPKIGIVDWVENAITFEVEPSFVDGAPFDNRLGMTTIRARWMDNAEIVG